MEGDANTFKQSCTHGVEDLIQFKSPFAIIGSGFCNNCFKIKKKIKRTKQNKENVNQAETNHLLVLTSLDNPVDYFICTQICICFI